MENKEPIEFTSYYIKNGNFKIYEFFAPFEYQVPYRFVMDYPEDLSLLRVIHACLPPNFGALSLIDFIKRHKYFLRINHLPKITFYTCNYNYSDYIIETIQSVIEQNFEDWEYIIIDDCSTDNSLEKIVEFKSQLDYPLRKKIEIFRNSENLGLGASSNKALELARGKYICRVDSDDIINNNFASEMVMKIESENNIKGVLSAFDEIDEIGEKVDSINENHWHPGCALISIKEANEVKYGDNVKYCDGEEFWEKFCSKYKTYFYDKEPLWQYRQHKNQKSKQKDHPYNGV